MDLMHISCISKKYLFILQTKEYPEKWLKILIIDRKTKQVKLSIYKEQFKYDTEYILEL
jgi:hypothetical protein